jgi:ribonuclease J
VRKNLTKVKIIPLGGMNEIGKNLTVFECKNEIVIIDVGMTFPEDEMLGIDVVIPDFTYLEQNKHRVKGILLTHGHEDHIGALPYFLKKINVPIFGSRMTLGLVENKLKEHGLTDVELNRVHAGDTIAIGPFKAEFINVNHSIPDAFAIALHTPAGVIVHTGDFKIDYTPIIGEPMDFARLAELGNKGVTLLMADSTNAIREGYTQSEKTVGEALEAQFMQAEGRIIVASFASNVHRVQQIINAAVRFNRKVAFSGRSMLNVSGVATELGYLKFPKGLIIELRDIGKYPNEEICVISTGSQGEPMSALSRLAANMHRNMELIPGDTVMLSASPIPGNEKPISKIINLLVEKGVTVIHDRNADIHVSGHACREECKLIQALLQPKFFMPVHGEQVHLKAHADLAISMGMPAENILTGVNGTVIELTKKSAKATGTVTAGKILVDGLGVGDVGNIVLRDRKHLSEDGLIIVVVTIDKKTAKTVSGPDIVSRGFVYVRESEDLMVGARKVVLKVLKECETKKITDWSTIKAKIKEGLRNYIYEKIKRNPMILPVIMDV